MFLPAVLMVPISFPALPVSFLNIILKLFQLSKMKVGMLRRKTPVSTIIFISKNVPGLQLLWLVLDYIQETYQSISFPRWQEIFAHLLIVHLLLHHPLHFFPLLAKLKTN